MAWGTEGGEVMEGDAERGREISHARPALQRGLQQAHVERLRQMPLKLAAGKSLTLVKGETFLK